MIENRLAAVLGALLTAAALSAPAGADGIDDKLHVCSICHGADGKPADATIPTIWGQAEYFLVKQLHDFKSGDRESLAMDSFAKQFSQAELRPVAAYFSRKPWPAREKPAAAAKAPEGIAVCQICHQEGFVGGLPAPRLAGQSYEYLVEAMRSFAEGERTNNADMVKIMQEMPPARREEIARYLSSL